MTVSVANRVFCASAHDVGTLTQHWGLSSRSRLCLGIPRGGEVAGADETREAWWLVHAAARKQSQEVAELFLEGNLIYSAFHSTKFPSSSLAGRRSSSGLSRWTGRQRCGSGTVPWHGPCRCSVTVMNECANPLIIAHSGVQRGPLIKVRVLPFPQHTFTLPQRPPASQTGALRRWRRAQSYRGPLLKSNRQTDVKVSLLEREENDLCHVHRARRSLFSGHFTRGGVKPGGLVAMNGPLVCGPRSWSITAIIQWSCPSEGAVKHNH